MNIETEELRRLRWRCRRGLLELDIVLQRFLDRGYAGLDEHQRRAFSDLLELSDNTLLAYLNRQEQPEETRLLDVLTAIQ